MAPAGLGIWAAPAGEALGRRRQGEEQAGLGRRRQGEESVRHRQGEEFG